MGLFDRILWDPDWMAMSDITTRAKIRADIDNFISGAIRAPPPPPGDGSTMLQQLYEWQRMVDEAERQEFFARLRAEQQYRARSEHPWIPRGRVFLIGEQLYVNTIDNLHMTYPNSPVWSERTVGHRELERDRRLRRR